MVSCNFILKMKFITTIKIGWNKIKIILEGNTHYFKIFLKIIMTDDSNYRFCFLMVLIFL